MTTDGVTRIGLSDCDGWSIDDGVLRHDSGRYFSVIGVRAADGDHVMIDQPEVGILGLAHTGRGADRRWLVQDKAEPGTVGPTQIAPTVQATRSNYERVHGGAATPFLDWFIAEAPDDVLGSEQGDRFLDKVNSNRVRAIPAEAAPDDPGAAHRWMSSAAVRAALRCDFTVNTDARSVLASAPWGLLADDPARPFLAGGLPADLARAVARSYGGSGASDIVRLNRSRRAVHAAWPRPVGRVPLTDLRGYRLDDDGIHGPDGARRVGYFDVRLPGREVPAWRQPLLERPNEEHAVLLLARHDGRAWFNIALYPEIGHPGRVEFGPSLQTGSGPLKTAPETLAAVLSRADPICSIRQSDEGGRFYRAIDRYTLAEWPGEREAVPPETGVWVTAAELEALTRRPRTVSNELRTLISLLLSYA